MSKSIFHGMGAREAKATYTKLINGEWGIRAPGTSRPDAGTRIAVTKKSGETKVEIVDQVLTERSGAFICSIRRQSSLCWEALYNGDGAGGYIDDDQYEEP